MIKNLFLFLSCVFFSISVSHSSTSADFDDLHSTPPAPLESLLYRIKSLFSLSIEEPSATGVSTSEGLSHTIKGMESWYKRAKYGDNKALLALESEAQKSAYACVLMMKYYAGKRLDLDYQSCLSSFISFLQGKMMASFQFEKIEDPLLNVSLALYHQMRGDFALAEQFAQNAIIQSCIDGYNVVGNLYKKIEQQKSIVAYLKSAQHNDPTGIYKLARLCARLDKNLAKDLYEHAAIRGNTKAFFALGRRFEKENQRAKSISYILHLIETDPYLYVHMEQKEGLGRTAFYVAEKLLKRDRALFPSLLQSIYKRNPSKRKRIAHLLAVGYGLGKYGFTQSRENAYRWLEISATKYENLEDAYQFCSMSASDLRTEKRSAEIIAMGRRLAESPELLARYSTAPRILLVLLLIKEAEKEGNPVFFEEAAYWLLNVFNGFEEDSAQRKKIIWQIPGTNISGRFSEVEETHLGIIDRAPTSLKRQQTFYALGFHYLSGGFEGCSSLAKAQQCFFQSGDVSLESSYFYITVIGHYLSLQRLTHSLEDCAERSAHQQQEALRRTNAIETYRVISDLLDRHKDLSEGERDFLKKKVRDLSFSNLEEAALSLAFWFHVGMHGLSPSVEHEIYWLKLAISKGDEAAQRLLKSRYPLVSSLGEEEESILHRSRTHSKGKPDLVVVGGGISGVMTAISFAKAIRDGKLEMGKVKLVEQKNHLLTGASMMVSRQHRGGEYAKDPTTARQCLYGSAIWGQMYNTERMLTEKRTNDFLLAKASHELESGEAALSKEAAHYTSLDERYKRYLAQLTSSGKDTETLLFGPSPIFRKLEDAELDDLGLSAHFSAGISTTERGFNPVGIGATLEDLLCFYNIEVMTGYEVTDINALPRGGFKIEGRGQRPLYAGYLINAAWHNNSRLGSFLKRSAPSLALTVPGSWALSSAKRVFLRCLALVDISECSLPEDRSFFGLVGEYGGMVSCFNNWVASIFIPKDGLSYHGEYNLDESAVNVLPAAARRRLAQLESQRIEIAERILEDAKTKYPFLERARAKGLSVQAAVSENFDEIFKRTHINAKWVEGSAGCLEICSTKATFGPFQALQALARFAADKPDDLKTHFSEEEIRFLDDLIHPDLFQEGTIENVLLPESFKIVLSDDVMNEGQFLAAMRRYAFGRGLDFALFEKDGESAVAGIHPTEQLRLIGEEEKVENIDLNHHIINADIASSLFPLLQRTNEVKLGPLDDEVNDDDEDRFGEAVLATLQGNDHLENLSLRGWNLTFASRHRPLATLLPRLQEVHLKGVTLTLSSVKALFEGEAGPFGALKRFSVVESNPKKSALAALMRGVQQCANLEFLDLSGNEIGKESPDEIHQNLANLVTGSTSLKSLFLHNNRLFENINLNPFDPSFLPLDLEANPFLLAITRYSVLERVSVTDNGPASSLLQDRLDSYFTKKIKAGLSLRE